MDVDVCFIVEEEEVTTKSSLLIESCEYFEELLIQSGNYSEVRIILPE